jgi:hypothetical protein
MGPEKYSFFFVMKIVMRDVIEEDGSRAESICNFFLTVITNEIWAPFCDFLCCTTE